MYLKCHEDFVEEKKILISEKTVALNCGSFFDYIINEVHGKSYDLLKP